MESHSGPNAKAERPSETITETRPPRQKSVVAAARQIFVSDALLETAVTSLLTQLKRQASCRCKGIGRTSKLSLHHPTPAPRHNSSQKASCSTKMASREFLQRNTQAQKAETDGQVPHMYVRRRLDADGAQGILQVRLAANHVNTSTRRYTGTQRRLPGRRGTARTEHVDIAAHYGGYISRATLAIRAAGGVWVCWTALADVSVQRMRRGLPVVAVDTRKQPTREQPGRAGAMDVRGTQRGQREAGQGALRLRTVGGALADGALGRALRLKRLDMCTTRARICTFRARRNPSQTYFGTTTT